MSAIIAKLMNSTVGKSNITPLDTLLNEYMTTVGNNSADRLYTKLKADMKLIGSDDVYFAYDGAWSTGDTSSQVSTRSFILFDMDGTVNFKTIVDNEGTAGKSTSISMNVFDAEGNAIRGESMSVAATSTSSAVTNYELIVSINVTKGAKYSVTTYSSNPSGSDIRAPQNLLICATPVLTTGRCTLTT